MLNGMEKLHDVFEMIKSEPGLKDYSKAIDLASSNLCRTIFTVNSNGTSYD